MKSRRKPNKTFAVTDVVVDYACFYFIGLWECEARNNPLNPD